VYVDAHTRTGFRHGLNYYRNLDRDWEPTAAVPERRITHHAGATASHHFHQVRADAQTGWDVPPPVVDVGGRACVRACAQTVNRSESIHVPLQHNQSGYRAGKGCEDRLRATGYIPTSRDSGRRRLAPRWQWCPSPTSTPTARATVLRTAPRESHRAVDHLPARAPVWLGGGFPMCVTLAQGGWLPPIFLRGPWVPTPRPGDCQRSQQGDHGPAERACCSR
jgi:hypothetical protein